MHQAAKRANRLETLLSLGLLALLGVIAAGIFTAQYRFYPAVRLIQEAQQLSAGRQAAETNAEPPVLPVPKGIAVLTPPETFGPGTLSDKIDGKADLYLSTGFVSLHSQRFKNEKVPDQWLEVFIYDMGNSQNAFSVFSVQRRSDAETLSITTHAYRTSNALYLVQGPYYVEIVASQASEQMSRSMGLLADGFVSETPSENQAMAEETLFPKESLVENSFEMIASDAFGFAGLDQVFSAFYDMGGTPLMAFLSRRGTPNEAQALAADYVQFLVEFGGRNLGADLPIPQAAAIEILDTFEIIFTRGPYIAGVREATDLDRAKALCLRLYDRLKEH